MAQNCCFCDICCIQVFDPLAFGPYEIVMFHISMEKYIILLIKLFDISLSSNPTSEIKGEVAIVLFCDEWLRQGPSTNCRISKHIQQ